jgi:hypothetical protein
MKTELKHGMLHTVYTGEAIIEEVRITKTDEDGVEFESVEQIETHGMIVCCDPKCGRIVKHNEACFVDVVNKGNVYCDSCGKCIRYSRKKEELRNVKV